MPVFVDIVLKHLWIKREVRRQIRDIKENENYTKERKTEVNNEIIEIKNPTDEIYLNLNQIQA